MAVKYEDILQKLKDASNSLHEATKMQEEYATIYPSEVGTAVDYYVLGRRAQTPAYNVHIATASIDNALESMTSEKAISAMTTIETNYDKAVMDSIEVSAMQKAKEVYENMKKVPCETSYMVEQTVKRLVAASGKNNMVSTVFRSNLVEAKANICGQYIVERFNINDPVSDCKRFSQKVAYATYCKSGGSKCFEKFVSLL